MTKYEVTPTDTGLTIQITGVGERQGDLLQAFGECQQGKCTCQTDEYGKVAGMAVELLDRVDITLDAKPGELFEPAAIEACLDYTVSRTASSRRP